MSWFQFKRPIYPLSRRHQLRAVLPETKKVFEITHLGVVGDDFVHTFAKPLDRASMVTQLELDRGQIRISYKEEGKQRSFCVPQESEKTTRLEILDLGAHKIVDVDRKGRLLNPEELYPVWFNLGQIEGEGQILPFEALQEYYMDELEDLFAPKNPLALQTGYRSIRAFFFQEKGDELHFIPELNQKLSSGTIQIHPKDLTITFEWSKREVKRIVMQAKCDGEWKLLFPNKVSTMRKRKDYKGQDGAIVAADTISLKKGEYVFLDQFRR